MLDGIDPKDSDAVEKVARRIREHRAAQRAKAKARAAAFDLRAWDWAAHKDADDNGWPYSRWPKPVFACIFCGATSDKAKMVEASGAALCLDCAREIVRILESNAPPEV